MSKPVTDFFNKEMAERYDERNRKLAPISECLHFLMGLVLKELPPRSRVLCVGAGTGAEIVSLSQTFPEWTFVALEPSLSMLNVCRERIKDLGAAERCEFVHGYIHDLPNRAEFDAVVSLLVGHFIKRDDKLNFFRDMTARLRSGGYLIHAEISFDLDSAEFPSMLKNWEAVQSLMGATSESLASLPQQLKEVLSVLPPTEMEDLIRQSGVDKVVRFFQALMICGWYGKKGP